MSSLHIMSEGQNQEAPANQPPFVDTPLLAAKRRAFDNPTQANLDALIKAAMESATASSEASPMTSSPDGNSHKEDPVSLRQQDEEKKS